MSAKMADRLLVTMNEKGVPHLDLAKQLALAQYYHLLTQLPREEYHDLFKDHGQVQPEILEGYSLLKGPHDDELLPKTLGEVNFLRE